ncbi:MAG: ferrochelatase [Bdellovibrionales bacterium]|nr:ferrochelatase [Bdellovibrionales bacterium]
MKTGIMIGNLGTPNSAEPYDVGNYLREFLMDPYVIDKPFWFRWLLVNAIIVPFRKNKSSHAYKSVWTPEGSPLLVYSEGLRKALQELSPQTPVALGMNYGNPSIEDAFGKLKDCDEIILAPLYPQYALSSYEAWKQKALQVAEKLKVKSQLRWVPPFYAAEEYIDSEVQLIRKHLAGKVLGRDYDHILFSYHGLPQRHVEKLDKTGRHCSKSKSCCDQLSEVNKNCYRAQSFETTRRIVAQLGLEKSQYSVSFQSRLGRDPWIQPFTDEVIPQLVSQGVQRLVVAVPSFVADCLETLEEIQIRAKEDFIKAGGIDLLAIPCLNVDPFWSQQLLKLIEKNGGRQ